MNHLRSNIARVASSNFCIPLSYRDAFPVQNLLHIPGNQFRKWLSNGCLRYQGYSYLVVYNKCFSREAKEALEVKLSFRKPAKEYGLPGYCIVEIAS